MCDLHVAHDLRITNRSVNFGLGFAGFGCHVIGGEPGNTIAHDLIVSGVTAEVNDFLRRACASATTRSGTISSS